MNLKQQDLNQCTPFKPQFLKFRGIIYMVSWEEKQFAITEMNYLFIYRIYFNECTTLTNRRILHLLEQDFYLQHTQYDKGSSK